MGGASWKGNGWGRFDLSKGPWPGCPRPWGAWTARDFSVIYETFIFFIFFLLVLASIFLKLCRNFILLIFEFSLKFHSFLNSLRAPNWLQFFLSFYSIVWGAFLKILHLGAYFLHAMCEWLETVGEGSKTLIWPSRKVSKFYKYFWQAKWTKRAILYFCPRSCTILSFLCKRHQIATKTLVEPLWGVQIPFGLLNTDFELFFLSNCAFQILQQLHFLILQITSIWFETAFKGLE